MFRTPHELAQVFSVTAKTLVTLATVLLVLVHPSASWHFDLGEVLAGGAFDVQLTPFPPKNLDEHMETLILKSKHGDPFKCHIPITVETDNIPEEIDPIKALASLKNACFATTDGWWSYDICYGKAVKQFHVLADGTKDTMRVLGVYNGTTPLKAGLMQSFGGGTICDVTNKPREVSVMYSCKLGSPEQVHNIREPSTCSYKIDIVTNLLCPVDNNKASPMSCYPIDTDGKPRKKPADVTFEIGDAWTGSYTCQGEQWLRFRVLRILDTPTPNYPKQGASETSETSQEASGTSETTVVERPRITMFVVALAFRHLEANGMYRGLAKFDHTTRVLSLSTGPWIVRPEGFMPLAFEGKIGVDGGVFYGTIPSCQHGPFSLKKEADKFDPTSFAALADVHMSGDDVTDMNMFDDFAWPSKTTDNLETLFQNKLLDEDSTADKTQFKIVFSNAVDSKFLNGKQEKNLAKDYKSKVRAKDSDDDDNNNDNNNNNNNNNNDISDDIDTIDDDNDDDDDDDVDYDDDDEYDEGVDEVGDSSLEEMMDDVDMDELMVQVQKQLKGVLGDDFKGVKVVHAKNLKIDEQGNVEGLDDLEEDLDALLNELDPDDVVEFESDEKVATNKDTRGRRRYADDGDDVDDTDDGDADRRYDGDGDDDDDGDDDGDDDNGDTHLRQMGKKKVVKRTFSSSVETKTTGQKGTVNSEVTSATLDAIRKFMKEQKVVQQAHARDSVQAHETHNKIMEMEELYGNNKKRGA